MSVTYYVALPFVQTEDGIAAGQAMECPNGPGELKSWGAVLHTSEHWRSSARAIRA